MTDLYHREIAIDARTIDTDERVVSFVASTQDVDSHGTRITANWRLDRFNANPVVLWAHDQRSLPIGKALRIKMVGAGKAKRLEIDVQFAPAELNEHAERVYRMVLDGYIRGGSVGFHPHSARMETTSDVDVIVLDDNELFEFSVAPVPSNPATLAKLRARAMNQELPPAVERGGDIETHSNEECHMASPEETAALKTTVADRDARIASLESAIAERDAKLATVSAQTEVLVGERNAALARADAAESRIVEQDVDKLVGVKILPAERDAYVQLAKQDRSLFDKLIAQRGDLNHGVSMLGTAPVDADRSHTDSLSLGAMAAEGLED